MMTMIVLELQKNNLCFYKKKQKKKQNKNKTKQTAHAHPPTLRLSIKHYNICIIYLGQFEVILIK